MRAHSQQKNTAHTRAHSRDGMHAHVRGHAHITFTIIYPSSEHAGFKIHSAPSSSWYSISSLKDCQKQSRAQGRNKQRTQSQAAAHAYACVVSGACRKVANLGFLQALLRPQRIPRTKKVGGTMTFNCMHALTCACTHQHVHTFATPTHRLDARFKHVEPRRDSSLRFATRKP